MIYILKNKTQQKIDIFTWENLVNFVWKVSINLFSHSKCTLYSLHLFIYNSHTLKMGQPIKTTYSGQAGPDYIVNCDFFIVLSRAL